MQYTTNYNLNLPEDTDWADNDTLNPNFTTIDTRLKADADEIAKINSVKTATIGTTWSGVESPYTQSVSISGILSTDTPIVGVVYSSTLATAIAQKEAWGLIGDIETNNGSITVRCFGNKPEVEIPIQLKGV